MTGPTLVVDVAEPVGARVAERLWDAGHPIVVGLRDGDPPFDWGDAGGWPALLAGVGAIFLGSGLDRPAAGRAMALRAFAALAAGLGVRRLVLLSGRGEEAGRVEEEAVRESGAEWTILRAGWLAQAFSESGLRGGVAEGEVALPVDDAREPFVDADDIAEVAVAALTEPGHAGRILELTGPRALTFADAVGEIARASGRPVRSRRVTPDEFANGLLARGVSAAEVEGLLHRFAMVVEGANAFPRDGVERVLGRGPRDFGWYARRAAVADAWGWRNGRA